MFQNADPAAVQSVINLVKDLIAEGQTKKQNIIAVHEAAVEATEAAEGELAVALDELEMAAGERVEADDEVKRLNGVLSQRQQEESAASEAKAASAESLKDAQEWMDNEVSRINGEKTSLEEVLSILDALPANFLNRKLLKVSNVLSPLGMLSSLSTTDPAVVAEVVDLVNNLITVGEQVRADVTAARDDAQIDLSTKTNIWNSAVTATVTAEDELAAGETDAANKLFVQNNKRQVFDEATSKKDAAVADEAEKKGVKDTQVPILDHEDEELNNVVEILENFKDFFFFFIYFFHILGLLTLVCYYTI